VPVRFRRRIRFDGGELLVEDVIAPEKGVRFRSLSVGGEFFVRYVPQSRYFQLHELDIFEQRLEPDAVERLNASAAICVTRRVGPDGVEVEVHSGEG